MVIAQNPNTDMATVDTDLSPDGPDVNNNISLLLRCQNLERTGIEIPLKITKCPLGFIYSQADSMCKCAEVLKILISFVQLNSELLVYYMDTGMVLTSTIQSFLLLDVTFQTM